MNDLRTIREVHADGQGARLGVMAGDALISVGGTDVTSIDYQAILAMIKASERPVVLVFLRRGPSAARTAVTAAGGFLKKALVTGVSLIAAVDRAISVAVDDGARVCQDSSPLYRRVSLYVCNACRKLSRLLEKRQRELLACR